MTIGNSTKSSKQGSAALLAIATALIPTASFGQSYFYNSPQDTMAGLSDSLQASANYGAGILLSNIDTGAQAQWFGFGGRMNTSLSVCLVSTGPCSSALASQDDNGHGTWTMSQMIGASVSGVTGFAPAATGFAVKVLNAQATGTWADVGSGINYAAAHGANVINASITFTAVSNVLAAINNAAAQGATIVWAGGNSNGPFNTGQNVAGLTDQAIQHLILTGSTDLSRVKSSFSNTPGSAGFISTSGKFYSFASRWIVAVGENLWGAYNGIDPNTGKYDMFIQYTGTSMTAPQAAGAVALLEARWPFLISTGQAPAILLQASQDLGAPGVDGVYGTGYLRVDQAFQPVGPLTVPVGGKNVPVANIGASPLLAANALGNLHAVAGRLQTLTAYDFYHRNYLVAMPFRVANKPSPTGTSTATALATGTLGATARKFTDIGDGQYLSLSLTSIASEPIAMGHDQPNAGLIRDPSRPGINDWSIGFAQKGSYIGVGQGSGAALSFGEARWQGRTAFLTSSADVSGSLLSLANSSGFAAAGYDVTPKSRISVAFSTASADDPLQHLAGTGAAAQATALGYTFRPSRAWQVSFTASFLTESNEYLGGQSGGYVQLGGDSATSHSFGVATAIDLGGGYTLGFDTAWSSTDATHNENSLITGTSSLNSFAFGAALAKEQIIGDHDDLSVSIKKPLRAYGGSATLTTGIGTDMSGEPVIAATRVSLVPTGNETDFGVAYRTPLARGVGGSLNLAYRQDADNIAGARDAAAMLRLNMGF